MAFSLRSRKQFDEPKVVEKTTRDKGKNIEDPKAKEENVQKELPSNQSEEVKPHVPPIPFPQRLKDQTKKKIFMKYLDMFKKIQMNILFIEAISHMPHYAKILKEIVSSKKKVKEYATIALTEQCSVVIQQTSS